ncbi:MAG: DUF6538 domain-containing protein, partial [Phenylobacterium sp.]
ATRNSYLRAADSRNTFRRRIPSHLQALAGTREVVRALGAISPREAHKEARILAALIHERSDFCVGLAAV